MSNQTQEEFNFSESFSRLKEIAEEFEQEDVDLEEGIKKFEEGCELAEKLKDRLEEAENKVKEIKDDFDIEQ